MASSGGQIRPSRYLATFVGIIVVLYALVFLTGGGSLQPKLGIDLQGGTRVTLTARTEDGLTDPPRDQLQQAKEIIEQRVNGLGVQNAEVVLDGTNLVITVPGPNGDQARSLGQTAQLRFRGVIGQPIPATASPSPTAPGQQPGAGQQPGTAGQQPGQQPAQPGQQPGQSPAPRPQGMGEARDDAVAPVAYSTPLQQQPPPGGDANQADPVAIQKARVTRQSTNPAEQQQAAAALDCNAPDPLRGYDDPGLPLVACSEDKTQKYVLDKTIVEGTEIAGATAGQNPQGGGFSVNLSFKSAGSKAWGDYTSANVGKQAAFVLDGSVVSAPVINGPLYGQTQVTGDFNQQRAQQLAQTLRYGSLPLSFTASEAQTVSATLGLASLEAGLIAGAIGLALVFVYCLFYYRLLGVLTILSLALSGAVVYAVLVLLGRWIGFTLDLAGVAGFIIAIGITADSFVIFFERLKDEMREGRSFRSSVPRSWERARRTILTADAVSFLAAAVLYIIAVGQVRGFAFTLGMSTVLDLVVVFLVTHPLVALISRSKRLGSPGLNGLGAVAKIGARQRRANASAAESAESAKGARV